MRSCTPAGYPPTTTNGCSEEGALGWSYREVLPYFKRAENNERFADEFHAYGGPLGVSNPISPLPICEAFFQAGQELGIPFNPDFNGARQEGLGYYQLTQLNARRSSTATGLPEPDTQSAEPERDARSAGAADRGGRRASHRRRDRERRRPHTAEWSAPTAR